MLLSIWLYPMIVDIRKQLDGIIVIIVDALDKDPSSGGLFILRNRSGNKLKCVYLDGGAFDYFTVAWSKEDLNFQSLAL